MQKGFVFWPSKDNQGLLSYQPKQTLSPKNYMLTWSHCASNIFRISHRYVFHPNWTQNDHWRHFHWWKIDICEAFQLIFLLQSFQMLIITHEASVHWQILSVFIDFGCLHSNGIFGSPSSLTIIMLIFMWAITTC